MLPRGSEPPTMCANVTCVESVADVAIQEWPVWRLESFENFVRFDVANDKNIQRLAGERFQATKWNKDGAFSSVWSLRCSRHGGFIARCGWPVSAMVIGRTPVDRYSILKYPPRGRRIPSPCLRGLLRRVLGHTPLDPLGPVGLPAHTTANADTSQLCL